MKGFRKIALFCGILASLSGVVYGAEAETFDFIVKKPAAVKLIPVDVARIRPGESADNADRRQVDWLMKWFGENEEFNYLGNVMLPLAAGQSKTEFKKIVIDKLSLTHPNPDALNAADPTGAILNNLLAVSFDTYGMPRLGAALAKRQDNIAKAEQALSQLNAMSLWLVKAPPASAS